VTGLFGFHKNAQLIDMLKEKSKAVEKKENLCRVYLRQV
jgi:hypothetical protein